MGSVSLNHIQDEEARKISQEWEHGAYAEERSETMFLMQNKTKTALVFYIPISRKPKCNDLNLYSKSPLLKFTSVGWSFLKF